MKLVSTCQDQKLKQAGISFLYALITRLFYLLYYAFDNLYLLKILNIVGTADIKNWRKRVFTIRLFSIVSHIVYNFLHAWKNFNDRVIRNLFLNQIVGLSFDLIPSIRESIFFKYFQNMKMVPIISDGWVGLGGTIAAIMECVCIAESLNLGNKEFIMSCC